MPTRASSGAVDAAIAALITEFDYGVIVLFEGTMPASADTDETGYQEVATITIDGEAFTGGSGSGDTYGLRFEAGSTGVMQKPSGSAWKGTNDTGATRTVGWGRLYANDFTTGTSTSASRIDFNAATSGAPLTMTSLTVASGADVEIDTCTVTLPRS